jgi:hypothetical protein
MHALPDESTIVKFRHLLERHQLTAQMMNVINDTLEQRGLLLKGGTMVDATIIHALSSTKNRDKQRDPDMYQTRKGNQWFFGMKIHIGADVVSSLCIPCRSRQPTHRTSASWRICCERATAQCSAIKAMSTTNSALGASGRRVLGHIAQGQQTASGEPGQQELQIQDVFDPGACGACVSSDQAPIRLHEGALQRDPKKRRTGVFADRLDQSLPGEASADDLRGEIRPLSPQSGRARASCTRNPAATTEKSIIRVGSPC